MKRGFTIVELMMVCGIIAILMGIVTTAASSSIKSSRRQKADALCTLVQAGLSTYREQKGEWPVNLPTSRSNNEGSGGKTDPDKIVLTGEEVRESVRKLVHEAKENNPMMDISGLFVSDQDGEPSGREADGRIRVKPAYGLDFMSAVKGTKRTKKRMSVGKMYFGYPDPESGYFLRFRMVYSIPTDSMTVGLQR